MDELNSTDRYVSQFVCQSTSLLLMLHMLQNKTIHPTSRSNAFTIFSPIFIDAQKCPLQFPLLMLLLVLPPPPTLSHATAHTDGPFVSLKVCKYSSASNFIVLSHIFLYVLYRP